MNKYWLDIKLQDSFISVYKTGSPYFSFVKSILELVITPRNIKSVLVTPWYGQAYDLERKVTIDGIRIDETLLSCSSIPSRGHIKNK